MATVDSTAAAASSSHTHPHTHTLIYRRDAAGGGHQLHFRGARADVAAAGRGGGIMYTKGGCEWVQVGCRATDDDVYVYARNNAATCNTPMYIYISTSANAITWVYADAADRTRDGFTIIVIFFFPFPPKQIISQRNTVLREWLTSRYNIYAHTVCIHTVSGSCRSFRRIYILYSVVPPRRARIHNNIAGLATHIYGAAKLHRRARI